MAGAVPSDVINQINLSRPNTNTPLAEALWSAAGISRSRTRYRGTTPRAAPPRCTTTRLRDEQQLGPDELRNGGYPRWPVCQKNFVLLLTDGEPCSDGNIPTNIRDYPIGKSPFQCVVGYGLSILSLDLRNRVLLPRFEPRNISAAGAG